MKYLSKALAGYLCQRIDHLGRGRQKDSSEMRIVMESLPAQIVLQVGEILEEYRQQEMLRQRRIRLIYKVAYGLGHEWASSHRDDLRDVFKEIRDKGWYDEENHLTRWRNTQRDPAREDVLIVVLVGFDRVADQSSLADFYRLDHPTIWRQVLGRKFHPWLKEKLREAGVEWEEEHLDEMDEVLRGLLDASLADLPGISRFLENLSLGGASDGRDALSALTRNLGEFTLPRMDGLARLAGRRRRKVPQYFTHALEFFSYGKFLEPRDREKAAEKVKDFSHHFPKETIDKEVLGDYASMGTSVEEAVDRFVQGLKDYIENNSPEERERLRTVDFVFLQDKVLEFKTPKKSAQPKIKKLKGDPLPVVLRALWIGLKEYKNWAWEKELAPAQALTAIEIRGDLFKHDGEGDSKPARDEDARRQLRRILGGLDEYLEKRLAFAPDRDDPNRLIEVRCALCPDSKESTMAFESARSAEPSLKFTVSFSAGEQSFSRTFLWLFPRLHSYRTMAALFEEFRKKRKGIPLPVFTIPHFGELMQAKDEEEANRILQFALEELEVENLLDAPGWDAADTMHESLKNLAAAYALFVERAYTDGVFNALEERYTELESAYRKAYGDFLDEKAHYGTHAGPLLFKAFCILGQRSKGGDLHWMWQPHESAVVVTPLHPALLEMLFHQHAYLCEAFGTAAQEGLSSAEARALSEKKWTDIEELAQIQWPLYGTLRGAEAVLDTNVRGHGLIHLVGQNPDKNAQLTTRLLLRYEAEEDDELADEELFKETPESRLIQRILEDYRRLHPHGDDGLAVAAYCGRHVQHLIAGLHAFLEKMFESRQDEGPYTLALTIFSESRDDTIISRWVREWRQRWEMAEEDNKFAHYRQCRISVAHRLVASNQNHAHFTGLLAQIHADVSFLINFITPGLGGDRFLKTDKFDHRMLYRMFPVLEKMCCVVIGGPYERTRERILSNRQFKLGTLHTGVMAKLSGKTADGDREYLVIGGGDFGPWVTVVDKLHERSTWVVCIDPLVDEYLLAKGNGPGEARREIIGFGSGVGAHGEYNYTVSTEKSSLESISKKIQSHVASKFGVMDKRAAERIAGSLIREAACVAGMSLVKATGPTEYVRDFMAHAMVRKLLPKDPAALCDEIMSLDAFRHWFDAASTDKRPDLLHVRAFLRDRALDVEARVIECKLAQQSERHLEKAHDQVVQGLQHLMHCFQPHEGSLPEGLDQRPDQRYWWLQLHRLLASKTRVQSRQLEETVAALENLSEGRYTIRWGAAVVTFWTDWDGSDLKDDGRWNLSFRGQEVSIKRLSAGKGLIQALCDDGVGNRFALPVETAVVFRGAPLGGEKAEAEEPPEEGDHAERQAIPVPEPVVSAITGWKPESAVEPKDLRPSLPERILLGRGSHSDASVYWEFGHPELPNRHVLIFGTSGMGKTYTIQAILCELARFGQNSLIVDYTNGFHDAHLEQKTLEVLKPKQHVVKQTKVPINPFRRQQDMLGDGPIMEEPMDTAQRVAGVFSEVYELGDQQKSAIYSAVKRGIEQYGDAMSLGHLAELLMECAEGGLALSSAVNSVISKLQPFVDMNPFGGEAPMSWDRIFTDFEHRCHILQLAGYLRDAARLITEFSLIDFYWHCRSQGDRKRPKIVVLDEIQNLDQRLESPLGKFLTEGRKFGICLIAATQTLSYFQKDQKDRLFQAAHKIFFRPAETEVKSFAQILENATQEKADVWVKRLSSLEKGECYSLGPAVRPGTHKLEMKATKIRIVPLEERFSLRSEVGFRGPSSKLP